LDSEQLARFEAIEAELEIRNLIARYCFAMDDRDVAAIPGLFTRNARVWSGDGVKNSRGRDTITKMFEGRFAVLGATNHIIHQAVIAIEGATRARGTVSSHAEVYRNDRQQIAGVRYEDAYEKEDGAWRIADRKMLYLYYTPVEQYAGILGTRDRNLTYDRPIPADVPEGTDTFIQFEARRQKDVTAT
jgi:uncharacterized protein (TIGR02246 family)